MVVRKILPILACLISPICLAQTSTAPLPQGDDTVLEKVIVVSRHGVRSPLQTTEKLAQYSHLRWPSWDAPPGNLTSHGRKLMMDLGSFYGTYYQPQGLFQGKGCLSAAGTYVWSDVDERDVSTAAGFLSGLFPGCNVPIHRMANDDVDPIIHPLKAHLGHPDKQLATAEVLGRVGGDGDFVRIAQMPAFLTLDKVLGGCEKPVCSGEAPGRQVLFAMKAPIEAAEDDDHLIRESKGPLGVASTLSEIMLLEYADGKPAEDVGFGRLSRADLTQILSLHSVYFDLSQETDYIARLQASNLMVHVLRSLDRPETGSTFPEAFGPSKSKFIFLATHDTNMANVAGFLRIHWYMSGDQADPTPPGSALVFELRRKPKDGSLWIRTRFISETLDQMHAGTELTLKTPPAIEPIFVPGCSIASGQYDCPLAAFRKLTEERLMPEYVTQGTLSTK